MTIDLLFPTPVYRAADTEDFVDRGSLLATCLAVVERREVREREPNQFHRVTTSHLAADRLHNEAGFAELTRYVEKHARKFARSLGYHYGTPRVMQMWVNSGKPGDFVYPHAHPGRHMFLAGVYYVQCDPRDGISILLQQSREDADLTNELNTTGHYYEGQEGRLLLFRPETLHSTFPQQGESRVIVSFNLTLTDGE